MDRDKVKHSPSDPGQAALNISDGDPSVSLHRISYPQNQPPNLAESQDSDAWNNKQHTETLVSSDGGRLSSGKKKISGAHAAFELTYCMMLGLRTVLGATYASPKRALTENDFSHTTKYKFPGEGSTLTPAHKMRDFKFKDYSPEVFRHLRERFGIDGADYLLTITNFHYLEFISNSKSGEFFFYTHDRQFMIKTMTKSECKFLRKILPHYYEYVMSNPDTLMTRFYGIHRVKPHRDKKKRFLVMGSVFYTTKFIHRVYDLKGSTHGRLASAEEKEQIVPVLKDLDFVQDVCKIRIGTENSHMFKEQLTKDVYFLRDLNIMDYSLLVGINEKNKPDPAFRELTLTDTIGRKLKEPRKVKNKIDLKERTIQRHQSNYGLKRNQALVASPTPFKKELKKLSKQLRDESRKSIFNQMGSVPYLTSVFNVHEGGVDGGDVIYFLGIIDILQTYNGRKRAEHAIKSVTSDKWTISAVSPSFYAERFLSFIFAAVDMTELKDFKENE